MTPLFVISIITLAFLITFSNAAGDTACSGTGLGWYTNAVGETPCTTYQRLRQRCNSTYQVGSLNRNTPPDFCDDQVADCCCNSISFALSMLCLNCQQGVGSSGTGIDAGNGAYQDYLGNSAHCSTSSAKNQSFPNNIQNAVCNNDIKIFDDLYTLFWGTGAWFYSWTSETLTTDTNSKDGNTFTHCQSTTVNSTSSSKGSSPTKTGASGGANSSSSLGGGAIAGIVVGSVAAGVGVCLALVLLLRKRKKQKVRKYTGQVVLEGDPFMNGANPNDNGIDAPPPPVPYNYNTSSHHDNLSVPVSSGPGTFADTHNSSTEGSGPDVSRSYSTRKRPPHNIVDSSTAPSSNAPSSPPMMSQVPQRETDAGPVRESILNREEDRLPPAYGEQIG